MSRTTYILLIIDNGSYGSTGDQPTYAGQERLRSRRLRRACGLRKRHRMRRPGRPKRCSSEALAGDKMTIIVSKCQSGNIKVPVITMDPVDDPRSLHASGAELTVRKR